ncbi:hypothetical protein X777_16999 [Ooceraea biroi]|uniref:Uncharacterized protein n=1 Tax=Ooceraea biroi TaxID=2015173 RepID=A0A026WVA6_OOCBI|nr:hypothetical protein X777_16999 [Ooceraea biroi]
MPRVIWSSGNCMLYVRAGDKGEEFAKNRGSFGHERQKSLVMVEEENEQDEGEARRGTWWKRRRGKGSSREVREEEPRARETRGMTPVRGGYQGGPRGGRGREGRGGECVRMLSADSSRPEDHTARPPCVPSALFLTTLWESHGKIGHCWEKFYDVTGRRKAFIICGLRGDSRYPRYRGVGAVGWTDGGARGCGGSGALVRRTKRNEDSGSQWMDQGECGGCARRTKEKEKTIRRAPQIQRRMRTRRGGAAREEEAN